MSTIGSIADEVFNFVEKVPAGISGTMLNIVYRATLSVGDYVGKDIGSPSFENKYDEAVLQKSIAQTANGMLSQGSDSTKVKLGDFEVQKGQGSNISEIYKNARQNYQDELKSLGRKSPYYKANG